MEVDSAGEGGVEDLGGVADCVGEVELLDEEAAAAGIGEHLAGEVRGAFGGILDFADESELRVAGGQQLGEEAGIAEHAGEDVVEVMRDAAGENAEALEFLGFAQPGLGLAALGDVGGGAEPAGDVSLGIAQGDGAGKEPPVLAVLAAEGEGVIPRRTFQDAAAIALEGPFGVVGMMDGAPAPPFHLLRGARRCTRTSGG